MDPASIDIHFAILLLPYLASTDVFAARRVNKHWNNIWTSQDVSRTALRIYGSASREHQILTRLERDAEHNSSSADALAKLDRCGLFTTFCIRSNNLRRGIPVQVMSFPVRRVGTTGSYVYTITEDILVFLSQEAGGLTVVHFNHDTNSYVTSTILLGTDNQNMQPSAYSVRKLRIFEDILVIEHAKEVKLGNHSSASSFWSMAQAFKLISPFAEEGGKVASAFKISTFLTFKFRYVDYTDGIISDHSRTHYAALNMRDSGDGPVGLYVWNIETGALVFKLPQTSQGYKLPHVARNPRTISDQIIMIEDSHVVLIRPDRHNIDKWKRKEDENTGFKLYIFTFDITKGTLDEEDGILCPQDEDGIHSHVSRDKDDESLTGYGDHIVWRVVRQRSPKISHDDRPNFRVFLNIWGRQRVKRMRREMEDEEWSNRPIEKNEIHQYELTTSPQEGELPIHAIYTVVNDKTAYADPDLVDSIPQPSASEVSLDTPFFINSNCTDSMAFGMVWTGENSDCLGTRLMTFHFGIRSFQLTDTSASSRLKKGGPLRYHLDYSSYLKTEGRGGEDVRVVPSIHRNVLAAAMSQRGLVVGHDVSGDERMSIFTTPREESTVADLVLCVWGKERLREPGYNTDVEISTIS